MTFGECGEASKKTRLRSRQHIEENWNLAHLGFPDITEILDEMRPRVCPQASGGGRFGKASSMLTAEVLAQLEPKPALDCPTNFIRIWAQYAKMTPGDCDFAVDLLRQKLYDRMRGGGSWQNFVELLKVDIEAAIDHLQASNYVKVPGCVVLEDGNNEQPAIVEGMEGAEEEEEHQQLQSMSVATDSDDMEDRLNDEAWKAMFGAIDGGDSVEVDVKDDNEDEEGLEWEDVYVMGIGFMNDDAKNIDTKNDDVKDSVKDDDEEDLEWEDVCVC